MHSVLNVKVGDRFGRLLVLETSGSGYNKNASRSKCRCDCGEEIDILTTRLWKLRSCGCVKLKTYYNKTHKKEWRAWQAMKARCFRKTNKRYPEWGGRGITVCDGIRYNVGFLIKLIGLAQTPAHSIDRKDNDGNYSCGECEQCIKNGWELNIHWATAFEQSQNRGSVRKYNYDNEMLCLSEICRRLDLPLKTIWSRINNGWDFNKAILTPIK